MDIIAFGHGETVLFNVLAKDRPIGDAAAAIITNPESQTLSITIGTPSASADAVVLDSTPQVVLTDISTGTWTFTLTSADLITLVEGKFYDFTIRSQLSTADPIIQHEGKFLRRQVI